MNPKLKLAGRAVVVGAISVSERFRAPTVIHRDQVPISGAHVTAEWLTSVLCRDTPGAEVVAVDFPGGSSGTSERVAIRVTYNDAGMAAGLPCHVFTKATKSFQQRLMLGVPEYCTARPASTRVCGTNRRWKRRGGIGARWIRSRGAPSP